MIYKISLPNFVQARIEKDNLILSTLFSRVVLKIVKPFNLRLKKRVLFLFLVNFDKGNKNLKKLLPVFYSQGKKIEEFLFGLSKRFTCQISLSGLGFKVELKNKNFLILRLGYSHFLTLSVPVEINVICPKETALLLESHSKEKLNNFVKHLQKLRSPDVYKNKGILIKNESLLKKKFKKR